MSGGFLFGKASLARIGTCHQALIEVFNAAIRETPYDFSFIEGHRTVERQLKLYNTFDKQGTRLTFIDGVTKKGKHNLDPAEAGDFCPYPGAIAGVSVWDGGRWRFEVVAGVILAAGARLGIGLRWGGDWDGDASRRDQTLHDLPHIELVG